MVVGVVRLPRLTSVRAGRWRARVLCSVYPIYSLAVRFACYGCFAGVMVVFWVTEGVCVCFLFL